MGRAVVLVLAAAMASAAPVAAAGIDRVIVADGPRKQQRIGPYLFARDPGRSYPDALEAFGPPTSRAAGRAPGTCVLRWAELGLAMTFSSPGPAPCSPLRLSRSVWFGATASGERWRSDRGLAVGDSVARLRRLYPQARLRAPATWILVSVPGEVGPTVYLQAAVRDGRVAALELPPGFLSVAH